MSSDQPPADRPAGQGHPGLRRRTGLTRSAPPARTARLAVGPARYDPARRAARTTLRAVSDTTARYNRDVRGPIVAQLIADRIRYAIEHDEHVCVAAARIAAAGYADPIAGGCRGPLDGHEIVRRGQRGDTAHTDGGVIVVCRAHHVWLDSSPLAEQLGLVIRYWQPEAAPYLLPTKPRPGDHLPPAA